MFSCLGSSFFKTEEVFGPGRENVLPSPERPYFLRAEELTSFARRSRVRFLKTEYLAQMSILEMDDIYAQTRFRLCTVSSAKLDCGRRVCIANSEVSAANEVLVESTALFNCYFQKSTFRQDKFSTLFYRTICLRFSSAILRISSNSDSSEGIEKRLPAPHSGLRRTVSFLCIM